MLNFKRQTAATLIAALLCTNALAALPVIPGAAGFGTSTPAGRGGKIIRVTNLNDSGPGSLRQCVVTSGPRMCVFEVSGTIRLNANLAVSNPNLTIAGQTAPAPGIMLRGYSLVISASDVLIQHLAVRIGDDPVGPLANARDSIKINKNARNVVIDHCSLSWAVDENIETYREWDNVTVSNTIISEGLNESLHYKGTHAYGALIHSVTGTSKISFISNLFAHSNARNPRSNASRFVFINNVVYNPGAAAIMLFNSDGFASNNTVVGNVFIDGKNTADALKPIRLSGSSEGDGRNAILNGTRLYLSDNVASFNTTDVWSIVDNQSAINLSTLKLLSSSVLPDGMKALSTGGDSVLNQVLTNAGSRPGQRDSVDARVVADVKKGTGQIINCVGDDGSSRCAKNAGGWPTMTKNTRQLQIPADPGGDDDRDGYTNAEEWLHAMAAQVEGRTVGPGEPAETAPPLPPTLQN